MYKSGTILVLKEPRTTKNKQDEEVEFPYNRVEVIGPSPVNHSLTDAQWDQSGGQGVIIRALTAYGSNLDEPYARLRSLYDVESIPENEVPREIPIRVVDNTSGQAGLTPEEVFAQAAEDSPAPPARRVGKRKDPLANG